MTVETTTGFKTLARVALVAAMCALIGFVSPLAAQDQPPLDERCTVSVLNRNVQVKPDGTWVLPNIPANFGPVRARVTCIIDGRTISGESDPFIVQPNGSTDVPRIILGQTTPIPASVRITAPIQTLHQAGETVQLIVEAFYSDGSVRNVTAASSATRYTISNSAIATISGDGLVQAVKSGTVLIQATQEGTSGLLSLLIALSGVDTDGDGIPDDVELGLGLDPNNPNDALQDLDGDGLSNLNEYRIGTDPRNTDTDGDGLADGVEVSGSNGFLTNPSSRDTDGDGVGDGLEVQTGSNPLDPTSYDLSRALSAISVTPPSFLITFNTVVGEAFKQLKVTGTLLDDATIDLTSTARGTNYSSSDLSICSFGGSDGAVFAGLGGTCTITITNSGFSTTAIGQITNFAPTALGSISIPGYANNVDVNGEIAYVAAGAAGLVIVSVSDPRAPAIIGSLDTPGNANDVRVVGNLAYVADGPAGLQIIDVTDAASPRMVGSLDTAGEANDVIVSGSLAFIADGPAGLQIIGVADPARPFLVRTVDTPGTARGVDVDGPIVVVADDVPQPGLRVINVANPANAAIVGSVALTGQPIDVSLRGGFASVAAYTGGMHVVDVRQPAAPVVVGGLPGSSPDGFVPRDVQVAGQFAIFAEQLFTNAVAPIVDVTTPSTPRFRGLVDFGLDYAGTGIAVSGPFIYWTGQSFVVSSENGTTGTTRLFIGQYLAREDLGGEKPTVAITAPAGGSTFIEGESLTVRATATDDIAVAQVAFTVGGVAAFVDTSAPYEYTFFVPTGSTTLVLGASALDLGGNTGLATDVAVNVIPDPLTTVAGRVVDKNTQPLAGVIVSVAGLTGTTNSDGTFSIVGVPTLQPLLVVNATLTRDETVITGVSAPTPAVRGGTTDVGDIVATGITFESDLGTLIPRCDFCDVTRPLPFAFPLGASVVQQIHINNGYVWFDNDWLLETFCCDLKRDTADPASGLYVNDQIPGRFIVTWFRQLTFSGGAVRNTIQLILFADGRIQFGYKGIDPASYSEVGVFPNPTLVYTTVDFSANPTLTMAPGQAVYEDFFPGGNPFDLAGGFLVFTPRAGGGFDLRGVPDTVPPVCSVSNPVNGSTLFEGEVLLVEADASDNGAVTRVRFQSSDGQLNADDQSEPFSAPFVVPVGVSQMTFTATAYDSWGNAGVCTSTANVIPGPPPTVTITSPAAGATLVEGSTIAITVDATNRVPVSSVDFAVNGVTLARDNTAPYQHLLTVPAGMSPLTLSVTAIDTVGKTGTSGPITVLVEPDAMTTVQGRVVDRLGAPVSGAALVADVHGVTAEIFNFTTPLAAFPDLTDRTPDIVVLSALNLRNPNRLFGPDPFGFGGAPSHAVRYTATIQAGLAGTYTFRLGVHDGGRLLVNGITVVDLPASGGQFQEGSGEIALGATSWSIQILAFDNGNPEVQLSYAPLGDDLQVVPPAALTPAVTPFTATSGPIGTFSIPQVPTTLGDIVVRASAIVDGRTVRGRSRQVHPAPAGLTDVGDIRLAGTKIGLMSCDSSTPLRGSLISTGLVAAEDVIEIDVCGAPPTLASLSEFGAVLVWSNFPFSQPDALGNVLADFVDQGGGVVLATYVFSQPWRIGGRITSAGYSPFTVSAFRRSTSGQLDLARSNTGHPIMQGVASETYFTNFNYTNPTVTAGSTLIAVDTEGNNVVAANATNRVVGVSIYPGFTDPGEIARLFANALVFVR